MCHSHICQCTWQHACHQFVNLLLYATITFTCRYTWQRHCSQCCAIPNASFQRGRYGQSQTCWHCFSSIQRSWGWQRQYPKPNHFDGCYNQGGQQGYHCCTSWSSKKKILTTTNFFIPCNNCTSVLVPFGYGNQSSIARWYQQPWQQQTIFLKK